MEAYLDGLPRSTSSTSISSEQRSTASTASTLSSTFTFSSISSLWSGFKEVAGSEVKGFLHAVRSTTTNLPQQSGGDQLANVGDKRGERPYDADQRTSTRRDKRRRVEPDVSTWLNDNVPPLMPPISPALQNRHMSSSPPPPVHPSSPNLPQVARRRLRACNDQSDIETLASEKRYATAQQASSAPTGLRSLSGRRKLDPSGAPSTSSALHRRDPTGSGATSALRIRAWQPKQNASDSELETKLAPNIAPPTVAKKSSMCATATPPPPPPPLPLMSSSASQSRLAPSAHPVLFSARASLRAVPLGRETNKSRASAVAEVPDMESFLDELGEQRRKLRKVGLPTKAGRDKTLTGNDELAQLLTDDQAVGYATLSGDLSRTTSSTASHLKISGDEPTTSSRTLSPEFEETIYDATPQLSNTPIQKVPPEHVDQQEVSATVRLSAARQRTNPKHLPGLELGCMRPITPRRRTRQSPKTSRNSSSPNVTHIDLDPEVGTEETVLCGTGERVPDPKKPFGRA
ncbi:uncharacterized protein JCM15063_003718 [Sporobolomyces koalae]|uniref:uncharacterized protein n=1 Tax=Sporobolomyces koalae TaxID=500713 RepID=UPI0031764E58